MSLACSSQSYRKRWERNAGDDNIIVVLLWPRPFTAADRRRRPEPEDPAGPGTSLLATLLNRIIIIILKRACEEFC
jgi:hypothetical protein